MYNYLIECCFTVCDSDIQQRLSLGLPHSSFSNIRDQGRNGGHQRQRWAALNNILSAKAVQAAVGGDPDTALTVLKHGLDSIISQTIFVIKSLDGSLVLQANHEW